MDSSCANTATCVSRSPPRNLFDWGEGQFETEYLGALELAPASGVGARLTKLHLEALEAYFASHDTRVITQEDTFTTFPETTAPFLSNGERAECVLSAGLLCFTALEVKCYS